jgi:hypothetical protein
MANTVMRRRLGNRSEANNLVGRLARTLIGCGVAALLLSPSCLSAQDRTASLKAAYLYYFTKFVYWPKQGAARDICVFGQDPDLYQELKKVELKASGNIQLHFLYDLATDTATERCDLAFLLDSEWQAKEFEQGTLLVTDELVEHPNAAVKLVLNGNKLTFDINRANAKKQNVDISAKLLGLAREVED